VRSGLFHNVGNCCRVVEDYGVIYLGSAIFKIARLLFIAMFSVHIFACVFFRVKIASAVIPEDVTAFYTSKNVASNVSTTCQCSAVWDLTLFVFAALQDLGQQYVRAILFGNMMPTSSLCFVFLLDDNLLIFFPFPLIVAAGLLLLCAHNIHNSRLW
jgi:hypothetical protein